MTTSPLRRSHFGNKAKDIFPNVIFLTLDRVHDHLRCRANQHFRNHTSRDFPIDTI
jgi:hypothetical protein